MVPKLGMLVSIASFPATNGGDTRWLNGAGPPRTECLRDR